MNDFTKHCLTRGLPYALLKHRGASSRTANAVQLGVDVIATASLVALWKPELAKTAQRRAIITASRINNALLAPVPVVRAVVGSWLAGRLLGTIDYVDELAEATLTEKS